MGELIAGLKFRKPPGVDIASVAQMFEDGYIAQRRADKFMTKKTFSPSGVGPYHGSCPRYHYLAFEGSDFVETNDALSIAIMTNGVDAHERLQRALEFGGGLEAAEVEVTLDDPPIRGFVDALVNVNGESVVAEFKTTRQESFVFRQTTGKPMAAHLIQLLIYMHALKKDKGFILYENRNDGQIVILPVEMSEDNAKILEDVFNWWRMVYKSWQDKELPIRPFRKHNKICKACPVFDKCWNQEPEGEADIPKMTVPKI